MIFFLFQVIGGRGEGNEYERGLLNSVERFDKRVGRWEFVKSMRERRTDAAASVFCGKIYVAGGVNANILETVEMFV